MMLVVTLCAGITSASPGCVAENIKLLREVTPQQCIQKGQEKLAQEMPRYAISGHHPVRWECKRG